MILCGNNWKFWTFQYLSFERNFWKTQTFLKKLEHQFLVESPKNENATFLYKTALSEGNAKTNTLGSTKQTYQKESSFASNYLVFPKTLPQFKNLGLANHLPLTIPSSPASPVSLQPTEKPFNKTCFANELSSFYVSRIIGVFCQSNYSLGLFSKNHSHKKCKDSLETRAERAVLRAYVENHDILEPILLYRASK